MEQGRLMEELSRMNCAKRSGGGLGSRILDIGWTAATVFMSSGQSLLLTSAVDLHDTRMWEVESRGALHREQAELMLGWSSDNLSLLMKSPVKNLRWRRSFLAS